MRRDARTASQTSRAMRAARARPPPTQGSTSAAVMGYPIWSFMSWITKVAVSTGIVFTSISNPLNSSVSDLSAVTLSTGMSGSL